MGAFLHVIISARKLIILSFFAICGFIFAINKVSAQTECQGPDCSVTDICVGPECSSTPGGQEQDETPGDVTEDVDLALSDGWCSVGSVPDEGNGAVCTYYCNDDRLSFIYNALEGIWVIDEGNSAIVGENDFISVDGIPVCEWIVEEEPPCTTISITPSGEVDCGSDFSLTASARVPCLTVLRDPYPRGIVSMPNIFWLNGPWSAMGSASSREWCTPDIRNYTLQVAWQFYPAITPVWSFDERDWADGSRTTAGMIVSHTYQTSSWGLPENGPSLDGRLELPAYQVQVGTAWQAMVRRMWEELVRGERKTFVCAEDDEQCWEMYALCKDPGDDLENDDCFEWIWDSYDSGWIPIDLRRYGYPQSYFMSYAAGDVTMPPDGIPVVPLQQRLCNVPVPIIESQALLNSPLNTP